jgi:hypothetical protein
MKDTIIEIVRIRLESTSAIKKYEQAQDIMDIFSQYLDDYTLEEFWSEAEVLTKNGENLLTDIKKTLKK